MCDQETHKGVVDEESECETNKIENLLLIATKRLTLSNETVYEENKILNLKVVREYLRNFTGRSQKTYHLFTLNAAQCDHI